MTGIALSVIVVAQSSSVQNVGEFITHGAFALRAASKMLSSHVQFVRFVSYTL